MSYDDELAKIASNLGVSIPLEQGSVLRLRIGWRHSGLLLVSIPLEQGSVLRQDNNIFVYPLYDVSIPLEQGSVLRLNQLVHVRMQR